MLLTGIVEKILFEADDTGFTVLRLTPIGSRREIVAVGCLKGVSPGEMIEADGSWVTDPKFGEQFKVQSFRSRLPETLEGIRQFLASSRIKGVAGKTAARIVSHFGQDTFKVLEETPQRLSEVEGIGPKKAATISQEWHKTRALRDTLIFLRGHGITPGLAVKIYDQYGEEAAQVVREDPYRLSLEMRGVGFLTADKIAAALGIPKDSPSRAEAGLLHVLDEATTAGHVCYPYERVISETQRLLGLDRDPILRAVAKAFEEERIFIEDWSEEEEEILPNNKAVYLKPLHVSEQGLAERLRRLVSTPGKIRPIREEKAVQWVEEQMGFRLSPEQQSAVALLPKSKVLLVTGGPGTGKTTLVRALVEIASGLGLSVALAAPTGRAAKRLAEATGREAKTLHRLLEYSFKIQGFARGPSRPVEADVVVVDESSMIDIVLMYHTLKAVSPSSTLILVGDVDQLPSVGPGAVLRDMIDSEQFPVVWLKTIFRQALQSQIVVNAHAINRGELPSLKPEKDSSDFYFLEESDPEKAAALIVSLVKDRLPKRYALDPMRDIQVLTPMHKGVLGASHLNQALREALNPSENRLTHGHSSYAIGDKLMQIRNDYDKDVYNGDMGLVTEVNLEETSLVVAFEGKSVLYTGAEIDDLLFAYAISIHKSQGCEYPVVVIALSTEHAILLQRNLLYTALTRGKKLVVLVGTAKAIGMAVRNDRPSRRYSRLKTRIQTHHKGSNSQYRLCQDESQQRDTPPPDRLSPSRERP